MMTICGATSTQGSHQLEANAFFDGQGWFF
jgi:hypothetical protein